MVFKKIGLIGGTGLNVLPSDEQNTSALRLSSEAFVANDLGLPSAPLQLGVWHDKDVVFLARHGNPSSIPPHKINYRANLLALQAQGVDAIIAVNAVGGIGMDAVAGALVIPDQIIDYTWGREQTFFDGSYLPLNFIDFTHPYDEVLRQALIDAAQRLQFSVVKAGTYGATQGPRLETPAEIRRLEQDGCDIVGMTGMPEAALARELNIPYASIAVVANSAAGKSDELITMDDIAQVLETAMQRARALIAATLQVL